MLQRIHKLVVRDIRKWSNEHTFEFDDGVTLLKGRNGAGKSTLAMALTLTMCHSANSNGLKQALMPRSGGAPMSSVTFTADAGTYTITKVWGARNDTKLIDESSDEVVAQGEEAEDMVCAIAFGIVQPNKNFTEKNGLIGSLNNRIKGSLAALFFHSQGTLSDVLDMGQSLRNIGLQIDDQELAKAFRSVLEGAETEARSLVSSWYADGRPSARANGELVDLYSNREKKNKELNEAREFESKLMEYQGEMTRIHGAISTDDDRQSMRERAKHLREQAEIHQARREQKSAELMVRNQDYTPIKKTLDERHRLIAHLSTCEENLTNKSGIFSTEKALMDQASVNVRGLLERRNNTLQEKAIIEAWQLFNNHEASNARTQAALVDLKEKQEQRKTSMAEMSESRSELDNLRAPSPEQWANIRELRAKLTAMGLEQNLTVEFIGNLPQGFEIQADGAKLESNGTAAIHLDLLNDEELLLRIAANLDGNEKVEDIESQLNTQFVELGAGDVAELNARQQREVELNQLLIQSQARLDTLPTMEVLQEQMATLEAQLAEQATKPEETQPKGDLAELKLMNQARIDELDQQCEESEDVRNQANQKFAAADALLEQANIDKSEAETALKDHEKQHDLLQPLEDRERLSKASMEDAQAEHNRFIEEKEFQEDAPKDQALKLENHLSESEEQRTQLARLEERVELMRQDSLLAELPDLEAEVNELEDDIRKAEGKYLAYRLLMAAADEAQKESQEQSRSQITEHLDTMLRYVWDREPRTTMDEDGTPGTIGGLNFEDESYGTREQYNVVLRMVLLGLLRTDDETQKPLPLIAPMMLDDALVFADEGRLERMRSVLQGKVGHGDAGLQLIVFSCRSNDYIEIANKTIDLDSVGL